MKFKVHYVDTSDICKTFISTLDCLKKIYDIDVEKIDLRTDMGMQVAKEYGIKRVPFTIVSDNDIDRIQFSGGRTIQDLMLMYERLKKKYNKSKV